MSHLFDKKIVEAFGETLAAVAKESLPAAVEDVLATPGLTDHLARTVEREVPVSYTHLTLPTKRIV